MDESIFISFIVSECWVFLNPSKEDDDRSGEGLMIEDDELVIGGRINDDWILSGIDDDGAFVREGRLLLDISTSSDISTNGVTGNKW